MPPRTAGGRRRVRRPRHRFVLLVLTLAALGLTGVALAEEPADPDSAEENPPLEEGSAVTAEEMKLGPPPAAGTTSVTQNLQGNSGISIQTMCTNCNSADLSVGSFSNAYISMTCDELLVPPGLAQIYLLSVIPPTVIDNVAVEAGAGRARQQGGAVGGGIELERAEINEGVRLNASADTGSFGWNGVRADLAGKVGWFGGELIGTWTESDVVDADQDGNPDMAAFERTTVEGRLEFEPTRRHKLSLGASDYDEEQLDGRSSYDFIFSSVDDRDTWNRENVLLKRRQYDFTYDGMFRDGSIVKLNLLNGDRSTDIQETPFFSLDPDFEPTFLDTYLIEEEQLFGSLSWSRPFGHRTMLRAGLSAEEGRYSIVDWRFNVFQGLPEDFTQHETLTENGFWVEGEFTLGGNVDLFLGVRRAEFEYVDEEERMQWLEFDLPEGSAWLPRTALTWKPVDPLTLRFTAGNGLRQPPPSYEEVCCGRRYRGNRGIRMEYSTVWGVEAIWQPIPDLRFRASAFRSKFEDLIIKMATFSNQYQPVYQNVNIPKARYESFSLEASFHHGWFTISTSANKTDPRNETENGEIPVLIDFFGTPRELMFNSEIVPYVPERSGSVTMQGSWARVGTTIDLSAQYAGAMLIQGWDPTRFDPISFGDTLYFLTTPSFWVTNARLTQRLPAGVQLFVGVDNIGDYIQADLAIPNTDYTWGPLRGRYYYGGVSYTLDKRMGS